LGGVVLTGRSLRPAKAPQARLAANPTGAN
jgi:hypothetical protein